MKIYKISYNVSQDDILASALTKEMFQIVSENMGRNAFRDIMVDDTCKIQFNTFNNINGSLRYGTFDIGGNLDSSPNNFYPPEIQIRLSFSNQFSNQNFNQLYNVLLDAVKHELGHYFQYKNDRENMEYSYQEKNGNSIFDVAINTKNFLLSDMELIPYIKGLVFKYKKSISQKQYNQPNKPKITFEQILDDNLNGVLFRNNINNKNLSMQSPKWNEASEIISEIKKVIINKAKELYPFLKNKGS